MKPRTLLFPLALALCACGRPDETDPGGEQPAAAAAASLLTGHRWKLEAATDAQGKRIEALFPGPMNVLTLSLEDGLAAVSGGCNRISGRYELDAQQELTLAGLRATLMACDPVLMQADEAIQKLLSQPQRVLVLEGSPPRLQLVSAAGDTTRWVGEPTPETRFGGPGERVFLEVAPQRIPCDHPLIAEHQCLQVREIKYDEQGIRQGEPGPWQALHEEIEGFEFREGERKVLRLKRFKRDPAPADASSIVYVLDMVVEAEIAPAERDG